MITTKKICCLGKIASSRLGEIWRETIILDFEVSFARQQDDKQFFGVCKSL